MLVPLQLTHSPFLHCFLLPQMFSPPSPYHPKSIFLTCSITLLLNSTSHPLAHTFTTHICTQKLCQIPIYLFKCCSSCHVSKFLSKFNFLKARQYFFYVFYIHQNITVYTCSKHIIAFNTPEEVPFTPLKKMRLQL